MVSQSKENNNKVLSVLNHISKLFNELNTRIQTLKDQKNV